MKNTINNHSLILLIVLLVYCLIAIFITPTWGDEIKFHYPNTQNFSIDKVINPDSDYSSAYGPLPYFFGFTILKIYNSIYLLRVLNFIIVILLAVFVYKIGKKICRDPITLTFLAIANPYLLRSAFTYFMFAYGILFIMICIYYYYFSNNKYRFLISYFFLGLAILSQQWMLVFVFAFFLVDLIRIFNQSSGAILLVKSTLTKIIFLLPAFFLFYTWKGLTHPNFQTHGLHPSFEHFTGTLANWGFATALIVLFNYKSLLKVKYIFVIFILPLIYLSIPEHSSIHGIKLITGVTAQLATQLESFILIPYKVTMFVFSFLGLSTLVLLINKTKIEFEAFLKFSLLGFFISRLRIAHRDEKSVGHHRRRPERHKLHWDLLYFD